MPIANKIVKDAVYIKYLKLDSELVKRVSRVENTSFSIKMTL